VGASKTIDVHFTAKASTTGQPGNQTINTGQVVNAVDENGESPANTSTPLSTSVQDTEPVRIVTSASIGDRAWVDTNGNGIQDGGEPGLNGVPVSLYDSGSTLVASTTTAGGGAYSFTHLFPADYYLVFGKPGGYEFTAPDLDGDNADSDANQTTGRTATTTLSEGENDTSWDAGFYQPASLGDRVWEDVNGNGIQDGGEPGINAATVNLTGAGPDGTFGTGDDVSRNTTTTSGSYSFTSLAPGQYRVQFVAPSGYVFTAQDQGGNDTLDSDANTTTGQTIVTTLVSGQSDPTWDAGLYRPAKIGDCVYNDANGDGNQDPGEFCILTGATVSLYYASTGAMATSYVIVTGQAGMGNPGNYLFEGLSLGSYTVTVSSPPGYVPTGPTTMLLTVTSGQSNLNGDFGFISPTAAVLASFTATREPEGVRVRWATSFEQGQTGFVVWRAESDKGTFKAVSEVILAGNPDGASYEWLDASAEPGVQYWYKVQTLPDGQFFGPVPTSDDSIPSGGRRLFVPLVVG
jgi:hypothetical protein